MQAVDKATHLTRPTPARQDAPFTKLRSRDDQRLNVRDKVRFASSLAAALLDGLSEQPGTFRFRL